MIMVIAIITSNNNSNKSTKVDLWTKQHHRTKNKQKKETDKQDIRQVNAQRNYFIVNVTNNKRKC